MLLLAASINACDGGAPERELERLQDREEERVRKEERDAIASARVKSLQEQLEDEKGETCRRPVLPPLSANPEIDAMLSAVRSSATARPSPPKCNCKPSDPLCDCL